MDVRTWHGIRDGKLMHARGVEQIWKKHGAFLNFRHRMFAVRVLPEGPW